ncbi:MAG TPA: calcium/proton exchanger [Solirubrobacterales bacterium]|jgi:Ca2+:H+ antiporter|nr:calcium/proton exchanger [Solirubrobacterales bacterium]HMU27146.1 calcium/proton exchanger [Solirubrobacterales bacterium]HMW46138.1 calcium/proton exchanger [Solirubrobacterales bacterium]HMY26356.1 calcium/proton exchanger [Solirubrobacterales bacterium]HNA24587.1 calcium/proton exchanger [Solirubrobacterales bacterium]
MSEPTTATGKRRMPEWFIWPYWLVPFIPVAIILDFFVGASATLIFVTAALGVIPTAALMGVATEELAAKSGPGLGGLLNVTFGNAPELIIALFALGAGLQEVVKASIVGAVLGNILLIMGIGMLAGGWKREKQTFNQTAVSSQALMLFLAVATLVLPAVFVLVHGGGLPHVEEEITDFGSDVNTISIVASAILLFTYAAGLLFSLRTHKSFFNPSGEEHGSPLGWSVRKAVGMLAFAGLAVGVMAHILVGSLEEVSVSLGLSEFFVGIIIVAIVGNAAESWVSILYATKNKMDLSVQIAIGSATQLALVVMPTLVIVSFFLGPNPMALVFNGYEMASLVIAVMAAYYVVQEGESNWFEGLQLLALYTVLGVVFYFA